MSLRIIDQPNDDTISIHNVSTYFLFLENLPLILLFNIVLCKYAVMQLI